MIVVISGNHGARMSRDYSISLFDARFASKATEADFAAYVDARDLKVNIWSALFSLTLYVVYILADYVDSATPVVSAAVRLTVFFVSLALMSLLLLPEFRRRHYGIIGAVLTLMGIGINIILFAQPDLDNTYYIALIQGFIMFSFVMRFNFPTMSRIIGISFAAFVAVAFMKADKHAAALQSSNLLLVAMLSLAGVYLLQRYQRSDFQKTRLIAEQNERLVEMLETARNDAERKLAAMNLLVHFVRTPVHQIAGFTDLVAAQLKESAGAQPAVEAEQSISYIKAASRDLSSNVMRLLDYHRLDDIERSCARTEVDLRDLVRDAAESLDQSKLEALELDAVTLTTIQPALQMALSRLIDNVNHHLPSGETVRVSLTRTPRGAIIALRYSGGAPDHAQFRELTAPLTDIENYLSTSGRLPMGLRTAARAAVVCGGALTRVESGGRVAIVLALADQAARAECAA